MESKERRKRKDPESRDFTCLCGKSYLSYAAAYTHAKNKHLADKAYIQGIKKPEREQLRRGRPKEKKVNTHTTETARLTLIQSAILKICEQLEGVFPHSILEGNQERNRESFESNYKKLCEQHSEPLSDINLDRFEEQDFLRALIKDFNAQVASRVRFACQVLSSDQHPSSKLIDVLHRCNIWNDHSEINEIILQSLTQWRGYQIVPNVTQQQGEDEDFDIQQ